MDKIIRRFRTIRFTIIGTDGRRRLAQLKGNDLRGYQARQGINQLEDFNGKIRRSRFKHLLKFQQLFRTPHNPTPLIQ